MQDKLIQAIDAAEANAYGNDNDGDLSAERALNIDLYNGENVEPAPDGRSQVVDHSVFETIQWMMPSLTRIFANGDNVVEFAPTGPEDEETAQQESDYLNYVVTQKNDWFTTLTCWFQDALLTKNAYCLAFMDEQVHTEVESYTGQSEEGLAFLLDDDVELVGSNAYPDPEDKGGYIDAQSGQEIPEEALQQAAQQGMQIVEKPPRTLYDVELKRTKATKKLQFKVLPPERVKVDGNATDYTTKGCDYFEYWEHVTISDLRKQGFDVPDDIEADPDTDSDEDDARDKYQTTSPDGSEMVDPSLRLVKARTIWIRFDYDGDGIAELQKVIRVGNEIFAHDPASRIPVASIVPYPESHRHIGRCVADLVQDIQRIKTVILRAGLDSLYLSTRPRHAVSSKVNLDDLLNHRAGGAVRLFDDAVPGEGHIMPLQTEFVLPQAIAGLQHMDTMKESRVGVNGLFQGIDEGTMNDHNRIGQLSTMAAQRVEQIARVFSSGVEYLFSLAHELIIKEGHSGETMRLRGEWIEIDPTQWRTGRDMQVVAPFNAGNKDVALQRAMMIAGVQERIIAGGLTTVVQADDVYNLATEIAKAADYPSPEKFFTDPSTVEPPPPPPDYTAEALRIEDKKADNAAADSQIDAEVKKYEIETDARVETYKTDTQAQLQLALAGLKGEGAMELEQVRAQLKPAPEPKKNNDDKLGKMLKEQSQALAEVVKNSSAEKEIIRDKDGKVVGARVKK